MEISSTGLSIPIDSSSSVENGAIKFTKNGSYGGMNSGSAHAWADMIFTGSKGWTGSTESVTAGGSISGGSYSFTGSSGTTETKGSGNSFNVMPPYVVKYCWERTA